MDSLRAGLSVSAAEADEARGGGLTGGIAKRKRPKRRSKVEMSQKQRQVAKQLGLAREA